MQCVNKKHSISLSDAKRRASTLRAEAGLKVIEEIRVREQLYNCSRTMNEMEPEY